jgi:amidase
MPSMINKMTSAGRRRDPPNDPLGAFCRENHAVLEGTVDGPLAGHTFAAKDVFDIAGERTGFGNPTWLATHTPAVKTAEAVLRLVDAGANMIARTVTDELTYSLTGENIHYGTPINPRCLDRVPGGSSSGSAVAVAGGLVDFSLGTDCGGSVRLPASYCGVFGMRPTHGRVPLHGVVPFAPSFDTAGWFAVDAILLERVGRTLLDDKGAPSPPHRLLIPVDAFALVEPPVVDALRTGVNLAGHAVGRTEEVTVSVEGLATWMEVFRTIQAAEIWANHGSWIREAKPKLGPGIRERVEWASTIDATDVADARSKRKMIISRLEQLLCDGFILCLPTAPRIAPLRNSSTSDLEVTYRSQAMCLLCIAGLGGLPQVTLPLAELDGCPLGLSLVGPRGSDVQLLDLAVSLTRRQ